MRPGGIEVHVNRERARPPDGNRGYEGPQRPNVFPGKSKRKEQAKETVKTGAESHCVAVRPRKAIGRNMRTQCPRHQYALMGYQQEGRPEYRRANREMIVDMSRSGTKFGLGLAVLIAASFPKTFIGRLVVMREIEIVFDERGAGVGVVADTIPANPGIQQRKCKNKEDEQDALVSTLLNLDLGIQARINPLRKAALRPAGTPPFQGILQESANQVAGSLL